MKSDLKQKKREMGVPEEGFYQPRVKPKHRYIYVTMDTYRPNPIYVDGYKFVNIHQFVST